MVGHVPVPSVVFSQRFLKLLGAPEKTLSLSFSITAGHTLQCKAVHYTGEVDEVLDAAETAEKTWEVVIPRTSAFYKLISGEIT